MGAETVNLSKTTVNLSKSDKINLSKSSEGLSKITVALGWDEASAENGTETISYTKKPGLIGKLFGSKTSDETRTVTISRKAKSMDLDAWVCLMENGKVEKTTDHTLCYYGNLTIGNYIKHSGDNLTGAGEGDDEQIVINLDKIPDKYDGILVGVTIFNAKYKRQSFKDIKNFFVRVVDNRDNFEICRYSDNVSEEYSDSTTFIVGKIYKESGEWKFSACGNGITANDIKDAAEKYRG